MDGLVVKSEFRLGGQFKHKFGLESGTETEVQVFMRGMWRNAYGADWFAIGNINLKLVCHMQLDILIN